MRTCFAQQGTGHSPSHSGTQGKSEPCVQREPTGRAIIVIVIGNRKHRELTGDRKKYEKKRNEQREKRRTRKRTKEERKKKERRKGEREDSPCVGSKTPPCVGSKTPPCVPAKTRMCSWWKDLKNCKCGVSKRCQKLYQDTVMGNLPGTEQSGRRKGRRRKGAETGHKMESELMTAIQAREPRQNSRSRRLDHSEKLRL